ncbi:TPA: YSIRK-type signal peptide-containing protein, partial [Streptococcus suis]
MLDKKKINFRRKRMTTPDKRYRYSIRKFNVGIASVAIAAFMFLGNGAVSVSANELASNEEVIPTSGPVSEEVLPSSTEIQETEPVSSSTPNTETPEETSTALPAQTEKVVTEETVPATENADSLPTNESQQESLSTTEGDDALAAAKKVLEEVISEAEVLSADALRKAAKSTADTSSLEAAANATKAVSEAANKVFADEQASLEEVNAQITAIRTSVDALATELRSFTGSDLITAMLNATTATEEPADDADKSAVTAISDVYTAKTQKVTSFTSIPNNAIVVIQSEATPTIYTYKRFEGAVNFSTIKQAYDANQFVAGKTELKENETIYVVKEADLKNSAEGTATKSIEESLDLTKFRHRENMLLYTYEGEFYGTKWYSGIRYGSPDNQFKMQLAALARPGSFTFGADLGSSTGTQTRTLPKDNNGYLVVEPLTSRHYDEIIAAGEDPGAEYNPDYLADSYGLDWQYKLEKTNLFLSHIEGSNDTINQPNTVFGDLPPGVEVVFQKPDGTEAVTDADKDAVFKELAKQFYTTVFYDEDGSPVTYDVPVTYDEVGYPYYHYKGENQPPATLKFKFQVKKDGKVIQKDAEWRQTTIYQTSKDFTELIKTTTTNTVNDFEKGIVDNVDYSALPQAMKVEAVNMEKASTNLDGTTPQDQTLPEYTKPTGKDFRGGPRMMYAWRTIDGVTVRDQHATFPFRVLPNVSNFFNASVDQAVREYIDYAGDMPDAKIDTRYIPETHKHLTTFFAENFFEPLDGENSPLTPFNSSYNRSYWDMFVETPTIPNFEVVPADINLEALTITPSGKTYDVTHRFEKGKTVPANIELPAEISNRITDDKNYKEVPSGATRKVNDKISTEPYNDPVNKGEWKFEKWSAESLSPNEKNPAPEFVGTWSFTKYEDVVVEYIALKLDGTVDTSVTLKEKYTDSDDVLPGTKYNAAEPGERPETIDHAESGITYKLVGDRTESYTNGQQDAEAKTRGDVPEGGALIKYYYKPTGIGSVKIVYKALKADGIAEDSAVHLRDDYMDTENKPAGTIYNVREGDEQPASITYRKPDGSTIEYKLVADKSKFSYPDGTEYTAAQIGTDFATEDEFYSYQVEENQLITYTYYYQPDPPVTESKGSVKIVYKALNADGTTADEAVTLRGDINDTVDAAIGTLWNAKETGVDHDKNTATAPIDERPATLLTEETPDKASLQYKLVAEKTTVQKPTDNAPVLITADTDLEGQVAEGLTTITYYYKPVLGGVIVKYVNEANVEIAAQYTDTELTTHLTSPVQSYDAAGKKADGQTDEKPLALTGNDGKSYIFKEVKTGEGLSQPTGTLKEGTTTVVYVYSEKPKGSVLVRYKALDVATGSQEDNSVTLREDYLDTPLSYVDTAWSTVDKNVDHDKNQDTPPVDEQPTKFENINGTNYVLVKTVTQVPRQDTTSEATSGKVVEGQTVVTYYYAPVQTETNPTETKGSVVIEYRRLGDNKPIASAKDDRKDVVVSTTTNTKTFYVVDGQRTYLDGGENGVDTTVVTPAEQLAYTANETGEQPPTINFQDTEAGETAEKTYHFIKHDDSSAGITGSVEAGKTKTVVYLYAPYLTKEVDPTEVKAKVLVNYKIENTNKDLRLQYEDTPETVIKRGKTLVTYYMEGDQERVVDRQVIEPSLVTPAVTYDTTQTKENGFEEKPATLRDEKTNTTYKLVEGPAGIQYVKGSAESGDLTEDVEITYYYRAVPKGSVVIDYKILGTEETLQARYKDLTDVDVDTIFDVAETDKDHDQDPTSPVIAERPARLIKNNTDGSQTPYVLVETATTKQVADGPAQPFTETSGKVVEGQTLITYYYRPVTGSVYIEYKALNADGSDVDQTVNLRNRYTDSNNLPVGSQYNAAQTKVDHDNDPQTEALDERPDSFRVGETVYKLVQSKTSGAPEGRVAETDTTITYFYAPVQTETNPTENKGSVVIEYRRLGDEKEIASAKDDRKDVVVSTTTNTKTFYVVDGQRTYLEGGENGVDTTVATPANQLAYNANETGEQPATISFRDTEAGETAEKTYHFVKHDETSASITGSVEAGLTKKVVYLYSPEQTETIRRDNTARVTVNYYILGTSTPLQASYEDTPATKISETVTTNTYYLNANDERVPVGNPAVVTNPVDPAVTYNTTLTKADGTAERPTTLESDGKTYHLVEAATTFTEGTGVSGTLTKDTVVNYYYAEVKEEEVSRTPINGKVLVHYKRASDKQELKATYTDTDSTPVAYTVVTRSYYEDAQGVKRQVGEHRTSREEVTPIPAYTVEGTTEVPRTLPYENTSYHYIGLETGSKPLTGNVVEGVTEVTLLYTPELSETKTTPTTGSVVVRYKLEGSETDVTPDGFTLRDDYPDTTNVVVKNQTTTRYYYLDANNDQQTVREETAEPVPTNERYEITAAEAPEILVSEGKQYRKVRRSNVPESGLVPEGTTTITYYYAPIQGGVIVKYVNEAGAEIADDYTDTVLTTQLTDPVQSYNAEGKKADGQIDEKPSELVGKDGKTYVFKEVKSGDGLSQPTGTLKEGTTTVVYVYKEKDKGSVLVRYVALQEDGQTVDDTVHLADDYQDTPETYIGQEWNTTGNKADGSLERPADFRNVNGKDYLLVENKVTTTHDGQPVDNNPTSGQVQKGQTVVTYYYAPVPQGSVRIEYKALHPDGAVNTALNLRKVYFDTLNANVGTAYNASETGRVDHDDNPATPLEDEKPSQIVLGATTYRLVEARTTKRLNDGQDSLTDLTSGQVEKGTTTITYYYAPVLGQVIVKYKALNADGTAVDDSVHLADDYPEVTAGNVNEAYAITGQKPNSQEDEKPSTFVKAGKTYHLVASKTTKQVGTDPEAIVGDNHDGKVAEGTTLITFFYAPEQVEQGASRQVKGDVNIRYENTAGEEIKTSLPDTVQGLVATYTRPDRRFIKVDNKVTYLEEQGAETEVLSNLTYDATEVREGGVEEKP